MNYAKDFTTEQQQLIRQLNICIENREYSRDEIKRMMQDFNKLGKEIGKTTTEIAEAANDWLRAGYDGAAASQLT